jgi:hypothetical protein
MLIDRPPRRTRREARNISVSDTYQHSCHFLSARNIVCYQLVENVATRRAMQSGIVCGVGDAEMSVVEPGAGNGATGTVAMRRRLIGSVL